MSMFEIDTGDGHVTPSKHDARPWTPLPPWRDWRTCKCHAHVTVRYVLADGRERFQEVCPACFEIRPRTRTNLGRERAKAAYGSWRVDNAFDREALKAMPEWERVGAARRWIWQARYREHMNSPEWRRIRDLVMCRACGKCERCGAPADHVHHQTYDRLGTEHIDDLEALCAPCHWREHGRIF